MKVAKVRGLTWLQIAGVLRTMCLVFFVGSSSAQAQEHENLSLPFLEPTDVGMTSLNGAAVFEASIQPHLVMRGQPCREVDEVQGPDRYEGARRLRRGVSDVRDSRRHLADVPN